MDEIKHEDIVWLFREARIEEIEKFLSEHRGWNKINNKIDYIWKVIDRSLEKLGKTRNDLEKEIYDDKNNKDEHVKKNEYEQIKDKAKKIQDENKDEISQVETAVSSDSEENKEIGLSIHGCAYLACKTEIIALSQTIVLEKKIKSAWENGADPIAKAFFKKYFISKKDKIKDIVEKNSALICFLNPEYRKIVTENLKLSRSFAAVFENITSSVFKLKSGNDLKSLNMQLIVELANNKDAFDFYKKVFEMTIKTYSKDTQDNIETFSTILKFRNELNKSLKNGSDVAKFVFIISTIAFAAGIPLLSIFMIIPTMITLLIAFGANNNSKTSGKEIESIDQLTGVIDKQNKIQRSGIECNSKKNISER